MTERHPQTTAPPKTLAEIRAQRPHITDEHIQACREDRRFQDRLRRIIQDNQEALERLVR